MSQITLPQLRQGMHVEYVAHGSPFPTTGTVQMVLDDGRQCLVCNDSGLDQVQIHQENVLRVLEENQQQEAHVLACAKP